MTSTEYAAAEMEMGTEAARTKPGRKKGHKMPEWSKQLIVSRRDCIQLESSNKMLVRLGEAITEEVENNNVFHIANPSSGRRRVLSLVGCVKGKPANIRLFMFLDKTTKTRTSFKTQEIYDGLVSGVFKPENPSTRERLYKILLSSPEIAENIRSRAAASRERARLEDDFPDDDGCSMPSVSGIDSELADIVKRMEKTSSSSEM